MGKFEKEKRGARKGNTNAAKERQQEPDSYAAVVRRGVATGPPASSTHEVEETREEYEGGRNIHQVPPPGESTYETLTNFTLIAVHPLSCSCSKPEARKTICS